MVFIDFSCIELCCSQFILELQKSFVDPCGSPGLKLCFLETQRRRIIEFNSYILYFSPLMIEVFFLKLEYLHIPSLSFESGLSCQTSKYVKTSFHRMPLKAGATGFKKSQQTGGVS